ncbi:MAG TPA: SIMPL domain-containing protein [Candidatus Binatia bacterium]|jgi:hypothetical protein|nr:SIMPL domain-containing protein [Candidatus Binatia bacterium]
MRAFALAVLVPTAVLAADRARERPAITVTGTAEVRSAPDVAIVTVGATAQADTAAAAQERVSTVVSKALAGIRALGVPEGDVQTVGVSLAPVYADGRPEPARPKEAPRIVGYRASSRLRVRTDPAKVGGVIDAAVAAGATDVQDVGFALRDDTAARMDALARAAKQAQQKARAVADAMGVRLGPLRDVREGSSSVVPPEPFPRAAAMRAEAAPTPVEAGRVTVASSVIARYDVEPGTPAPAEPAR